MHKSDMISNICLNKDNNTSASPFVISVTPVSASSNDISFEINVFYAVIQKCLVNADHVESDRTEADDRR